MDFLRKHWKLLAAFGAGGLAVVVLSGGGGSSPNFPADGPAEFLYLDRSRVIAYLAELDGGTFQSETLTKKLSDSQSGEFSFDNLAKIGGSSTEEDSLARDVTPTAAADYFELLEELEHENDGRGLATISIGHFPDVQELDEGHFIRFKTHALRPPIYLNPYLATRQRTTMQTLFPPPERTSEGKEEARRRRDRVIYFRRKLGPSPRVVFALRPLEESEVQKRAEEPASAGSVPVGAEGLFNRVHRGCLKNPRKNVPQRQRAAEVRENKHVAYLMPMDTRLLTRERSLIKFGGGEFTVVGKVVRIFPEKGDEQKPAYVDSPTREAWELPIAHAPLKLLCSTDFSCRHHAQEGQAAPVAAARCRDIEALRKETEIPERGAVILPIAIYK